jgi:hypothetical protein
MILNAERKNLPYSRVNSVFQVHPCSYNELGTAGRNKRKLSKKCQKEQLKSGGKTQANPIIFANRGTFSSWLKIQIPPPRLI